MADARSPLEQARWLHSAERWIEACDVFLAIDEVEPLSARVEALQRGPGQTSNRAGATAHTLTSRELEVLH